MNNSTPKILWIDDEIDLLRPHILYLKEKGYDVDITTTGKEGLRLIRDEKRGSISNPESIGIELANSLKDQGAEKILQEIYDFTFRQLELSIREIGYGDQSINKKMKDYINLFHDMIDKFHFWDDLNEEQKKEKMPSSDMSLGLLLKYTRLAQKTKTKKKRRRKK